MAVVKLRELIGASEKSFEDALNQVIKFVSEDKPHLSGVKILSQTVDIEDGKIKQYKVNVKVAYRWEK